MWSRSGPSYASCYSLFVLDVPPFSKTLRVRTSRTTLPGHVAGSTSFKFVVLLFLFQLTFSRRLLVSSYLTFPYKYLASGLVKGIDQIRRRFPLSFSLFSRYSRLPPTARRLLYSRPTCRNSSDSLRDSYVSPLKPIDSARSHLREPGLGSSFPFNLSSPSNSQRRVSTYATLLLGAVHFWQRRTYLRGEFEPAAHTSRCRSEEFNGLKPGKKLYCIPRALRT